MNRQISLGKAGMALVAAVAAAMCAVPFLTGYGTRRAGEWGICLPSPNMWNIDPLLSWGLNCACIALTAIGAYMLNREYNFIRSTRPVMPAVFLLTACAFPMLTFSLNASVLVCLLNLMALSVLFSCYRSRNATQEMFTIGTFMSVGSMCQYAFIPYLLVYVVAAVIMKSFRIKELIAMGMGIVAPYWVALGFGLVPVEALHLPRIAWPDVSQDALPTVFVTLGAVGFAAFTGMVLALNNSMKLYAGNSRVNALNLTVTIMGGVSVLCMVADFNNLQAYICTLLLCVSVQVANVCALWHFRREFLWVLVPGVLYAGVLAALLLLPG